MNAIAEALQRKAKGVLPFSKELTMKKHVTKFLRNEEGLTTVEYAIAGGLVGAAVIAAFNLLGIEVGRVINAIYQALTTVQAGA
jgi:pilus assembly protein Flp/PilA